jgi:hypothetical protein
VQVADAEKEAEELRQELLSVTKSRDQWKASAAKHQSRLDIALNNAKKAAEERAVIAAANITLRIRLEKEKKAHIEGQSMAKEAAARIEP